MTKKTNRRRAIRALIASLVALPSMRAQDNSISAIRIEGEFTHTEYIGVFVDGQKFFDIKLGDFLATKEAREAWDKCITRQREGHEVSFCAKEGGHPDARVVLDMQSPLKEIDIRDGDVYRTVAIKDIWKLAT